MGVLERIRNLTTEQRDALRAVDEEERRAVELAEVEAEHLAAEEVYRRRRDRLLGRDVPEAYADVEDARDLLRRASAEGQKRFERRRMALLAGHGVRATRAPAGLDQLDLLGARE
jgi:hypothetical protein